MAASLSPVPRHGRVLHRLPLTTPSRPDHRVNGHDLWVRAVYAAIAAATQRCLPGRQARPSPSAGPLPEGRPAGQDRHGARIRREPGRPPESSWSAPPTSSGCRRSGGVSAGFRAAGPCSARSPVNLLPSERGGQDVPVWGRNAVGDPARFRVAGASDVDPEPVGHEDTPPRKALIGPRSKIGRRAVTRSAGRPLRVAA